MYQLSPCNAISANREYIGRGLHYVLAECNVATLTGLTSQQLAKLE